MIEILIPVYLCRRLGELLRAKARPAGWLQFLLVIAWLLVGEVMGGIVALGVLDVAPGRVHPAAYVGALLGGACGAAAVFLIAWSLPGLTTHAPQGFIVGDVAEHPYPYPPGRDPSEL